MSSPVLGCGQGLKGEGPNFGQFYAGARNPTYIFLLSVSVLKLIFSFFSAPSASLR